MSFLQDLRFAVRSLRSHAGTATFAALTLALGLAAALSIYAVVDAVLLRSLPYRQADQLVQVRERAANGKTMALTSPNYADLAAAVDAFAATAFYNAGRGTVADRERIERPDVAYVGGDFFGLLGIAPALGRAFDGNGHDKVTVIGDALWRGLLNARADVLGQSLVIDGEHYTIIGVMPPGYAFPDATRAWVPMLDAPGTSRTAHNWQVVARLRAADGLAQARLAADALGARLKRQFGDDIDAVGFDVVPLGQAIAAPVRSALLMLGAGAAFLLLVAVMNTANLLLALNGSRVRELAVRRALGASGLRIARQILCESTLVAAAACVIGLVTAAAAIRFLVRAGGLHLPRIDEIGLQPSLAALGIAVAAAIAAIVGAAVWWSVQRRNANEDLRESARGQSAGRGALRARAALLVAQTALTTVLLIGAGLLARSFFALLAVDPGFRSEGAVGVQLSQPATREPVAAARTAQRYDEIMAALAALPGVEAVGGINGLPLTDDGVNGAFWDDTVTNFDTPPPKSIGYAQFRLAGGDYFKTMDIRVLAGRTFNAGDRADAAPVAILSATAARIAWGARDPIGQRIQMGNMDGDTRLATVVGVVADVHERELERAPEGTVYFDIAQRPITLADFDVVVRSALPSDTLMTEIRGVMERSGADLPYTLRPLDAVRAGALAERRFSVVLLGVFSLAAFALAIGGVYGLMAFAVGQREPEFALRQALGASRAGIARLVLGNGLRIGVAGIVLGLVVGIFGARTLQGFLFGVAATDAPTLSAVAALLLATVALACLLPALRACRVAPREALT